MFNVQYYITKLEDQTEYHFPFTRIKQVEKRLDEAAGEDEETKEEEPKTQEVTGEEKKVSAADDLIKKLSKKPKAIDLDSIEEGEAGESN